MTRLPESSIDVDRLMEEIRVEVETARREGSLGSPAPTSGAPDLHWETLSDGLDVAEAHASVGLEPPRFLRLHHSLRAPARWLSRGVLAVLELVTHYQRIFNRETLAALRRLVQRTQMVEHELEELRREVAELKAQRGDDAS